MEVGETQRREARAVSGAESQVSDRRAAGAGQPADRWVCGPHPGPAQSPGGAGLGEGVTGPVGEQGRWGEQSRGS